MKIQTLCLEISKSPEHFNFQHALESYCASITYQPYFNFDDLNKDIVRAISKRDEKGVIKAAFNILEHYPFDIESHAHIAMASLRLNNRYMHNFHNFIGSSVLDVILDSGDGLSEKKPFKIFHPRDEGAVFSYLKKYPQSREILPLQNSFLDRFLMADKTYLFFDISRPLKRISN